MKIFQLTAALDQLERSIVGAGPMRMPDISPAGDPAVNDILSLNGLQCVVSHIRLFRSLDIQPLEQFGVPKLLRID